MKSPYNPPKLPPNLEGIYTPAFIRALGEANRALAKLGELPHLLPNTDLLAAPLLRQEAVLSSKIEGTFTTLADLFKYEAKIDDASVKRTQNKEVDNYVRALHRGMEDLPALGLSVRMIRNMHNVLLTGVRNDQGVPGEFRNFLAYVGRKGVPEEAYVPPEHLQVPDMMAELEKYINVDSGIEDPIVQCALMHYQFEAIHPFGDGNGRIGRLLIPLFLHQRGILKYPMLYVSEYFDRDISAYYELLRGVSERGDWSGWVRYFVDAVRAQSDAAHRRGEAIINLYKKTHEEVRAAAQTSNAVALVEHIFRHPYTAAPFLAGKLDITQATAMRLLNLFTRLGILRQDKGVMIRPKFSRPVRLFVFQGLVDIVNSL